MSDFQVIITGSIASGKSLACQYFREWGIDVVDSDQMARDIVKPGEDALVKIIDHFGPTVLNPEGMLDRSALAEWVFTNPKARQWLEDLTHPLIRERLAQAAQVATSLYVILAVPLLYRRADYPEVNKVLWLRSDRAMRLSRALKREGMSEARFAEVEAAHPSDKLRCELVDDVIDNNGSETKLKISLERMHQQYLSLL